MIDTESVGSESEQLESLLVGVLQRPAPEGARIVALRWLLRLQQARSNWAEAINTEPVSSVEAKDSGESGDDAATALHKVRVALRRLRSSLAEYRALLVVGPRKREVRHLRALNRATGIARDADVQREWLEAEGGALDEVAQQQAHKLRLLLTSEERRHTKGVKSAFRTHFDPHVERLIHDLSHYVIFGTVGVTLELKPFAPQVAVRLERALSRVVRSVGSAHHVDDHDALHRTRKSLKELRALLVPFVSQLPSLGALYQAATRGQDTLGAMRDAQLLASRARDEKLLALASVLDDVQLSHFNAFASEWLDDGGARALAGAQAAREALLAVVHATVVQSDAAERNSAPPLEIERKYLLKGCPAEAVAVAGTKIEQGYIPGHVLCERLRCSTYPTGVLRYTRTIKFGHGISRVELEEDTERTLFEALWPLTVTARVRKQRHAIREAGYTWEIDVFTDRELVLAEVELKSVDENPALPEWLAPWVVREVTGEDEYVNANLARPDNTGAPASIPLPAL